MRAGLYHIGVYTYRCFTTSGMLKKHGSATPRTSLPVSELLPQFNNGVLLTCSRGAPALSLDLIPSSHGMRTGNASGSLLPNPGIVACYPSGLFPYPLQRETTIGSGPVNSQNSRDHMNPPVLFQSAVGDGSRRLYASSSFIRVWKESYMGATMHHAFKPCRLAPIRLPPPSQYPRWTYQSHSSTPWATR